jgi:saccharopepsin
MKNAAILAASALLGSASAGVHKVKLQKVPLSEQLVSWHLYSAFDISR